MILRRTDALARSSEELTLWLCTLPGQTALIASNDHYGRRVLGASVDAGINVPEDLAVIGVDNDEIICELCYPTLSSVVPNTEQIGYLAAKTLHQLLNGGKRPPREQLIKPLSIFTRRSTDATAVSDRFVSTALQFIHSHATGAIDVNDVVRQTQSSRRFLEQRFRQVVGRPIHAEIARVRIETTQRLLTTTSLSIKEIACQSGFQRPDYLSAVFQKILGMSPSAYRQRFAK